MFGFIKLIGVSNSFTGSINVEIGPFYSTVTVILLFNAMFMPKPRRKMLRSSIT